MILYTIDELPELNYTKIKFSGDLTCVELSTSFQMFVQIIHVNF